MIVFGNRVLCLFVLFLLQSAGWMTMAQGEPLIRVETKGYYYNTVEGDSAAFVTYPLTKKHCEYHGFYLPSCYTHAIRTENMISVYALIAAKDTLFYIGADSEYSVHSEPDPTKRCLYSVPSLNCIYKWNQGLWANALGDGSGVDFYKGSDPSVHDAGLTNGYDVTVVSHTLVNDKPSIIRQKHQNDNFVFYLIFERDLTNREKRAALFVCEGQDGTINGVVPTTTDGSNDHSWWWKRLALILGIILILLAILVIVLCLYRRGYICRRKADGYRVTEE